MLLWFLPGLARFAPPVWSKMTGNTAIGMMLSASSFTLTAQGRASGAVRLGRALAVLVLALGVLTLLEYYRDITLALDHWFPVDLHSRYPGRPSPQTALGLALVGSLLLMARESKSGWSWGADVLALTLIGLTLVLVGGYCYGALQLVGVDHSTLTSPQTLLCFCCLTFMIAGRRAVNGRMLAPLVSIGIGSYIVRLVLLGALILPFIFFAAASYLIHSRALSEPYAYAAIAALESFLVLCMVIWMGRRINGLEGDLRDLSLTDELTRVNNRRGFNLLSSQVLRDAAAAPA